MRRHNLYPSLFARLCPLGLLLFFALVTAAGLRAQSVVYVVGQELASDARFIRAVAAKNLAVKAVDANALESLDAKEGSVLVVASKDRMPPQSRVPISRFISEGGHVVVVGGHSFDYTPEPINPVALGRFDVSESVEQGYEILHPQRSSVARTRSPIEPTRVAPIVGPDGEAGLDLRTYLRGMGDIVVQFDASKVSSASRSVLQFWAKGDHYMDLLTLEVTDKTGGRWMAFQPLGHEWAQYSVSFADFMPDGWQDADKPWPLLDPAAIKTVSLGTHTRTLWREKAMALQLGPVDLAENALGIYAPTSALQFVRIPALESDLVTPSWLFDPFASAGQGSMVTEAANGLKAARGVPFAEQPEVAGKLQVWRVPLPWFEHPGTRMGTDVRDDYTFKFDRQMRRIPLWLLADAVQNEISDVGSPATVAELRLVSGKASQGTNIGLFGVSPTALLEKAPLLDSLASAVIYIATEPKVLGATINTTSLEKTPDNVLPTLQVVLQNPLSRSMKGKLIVDVADGRVKGELDVVLPASASTLRTVELSEVPVDFPFERFSWSVRLDTAAGEDTLSDTVDIERSMLYGFAHLIGIQQQFPDGRYSHHYFGDAYGARAMLAYCDLLKREPERLQRNRDIWEQENLSPEALHASAVRFFDMLANRQNEDGSIPMGYGEHHGVYNVADGGQLTICMGQVIPLLNDDPERQAKYLFTLRRFADWAETFYIDEALSAKLSREFEQDEKAKQKAKPVEKAQPGVWSGVTERVDARVGHYGLGNGYKRRNATGPSWVMPCLLGMQTILTHLDSNPEYLEILKRNAAAYLDRNYPSLGHYQAEGLFWVWFSSDDAALRERIEESLRTSFIPDIMAGRINAQYRLGARATLRTLPLVYYKQYLGDTESVRATLLKSVWAFGSQDSPNGQRLLGELHPKPHHGESITAAKFAQFSAGWALELIDPGSSLLGVDAFPRADATPLNATGDKSR